MARLNGCPMSVREWAVDILSRAATKADPVWIAVKGLNAITLTLEAETGDGSAADSLWAEPYVTKRSGRMKLDARPVTDPATGETDPGQAELDYFGALAGCAADAALRLTDPYGKSRIIDLIVTGSETGSEDGGEKISWDCEIVGEIASVPYVQLTGIAPDAQAITLAVNESRTVSLAFTPENASNRRYSAASASPHHVRVGAVQDTGFEITGVMATDGAVDVLVRSMNNSLTARVAVTVV